MAAVWNNNYVSCSNLSFADNKEKEKMLSPQTTDTNLKTQQINARKVMAKTHLVKSTGLILPKKPGFSEIPLLYIGNGTCRGFEFQQSTFKKMRGNYFFI